jgi:hypothetical protein
MMSPGYAYTYTIPKCLAAGAYIVRHEIIALQTAGTYPGVQFYPSCHQISITSTGTSTGGTLHAIPGIYAATDPGITYNMYECRITPFPDHQYLRVKIKEREVVRVGDCGWALSATHVE